RGTVNCSLRIRHLTGAQDYRLNTQVLGQYIDQLQSLAATRDLDEVVRLEPLASLPGVVEELSTDSVDAASLWPIVEPSLRTAVEQLTAMRAVEGQALAADLRDQCAAVALSLDII